MKPILFSLITTILLLPVHLFAQWQSTNGPAQGMVTTIFSHDGKIFAGVQNDPPDTILYTLSGNNWSHVDGLVGAVGHGHITSMAANSSYLFAGLSLDAGVFRSADGGATWDHVYSGLPFHPDFHWITAIYALVTDGGNLYAATDWGIYVSGNNGSTWTNLGLDTYTILSLDVSGSNIVAGTSNNGVFISTDDGVTWFQNPQPGASSNSKQVEAAMISGNEVFLGAFPGVLRGDFTGTSWTLLDNGLPTTTVTDFHKSGSAIFLGSMSGFFMSTDNGDSWINESTGFPTSGVSSITISGSEIYAGREDGVWKRPLGELINTGIRGEALLSPMLEIIPNPNQGIFRIHPDQMVGEKVSVNIYDLQGKLVREYLEMNKNDINIDISDQPGGVYFVQIRNSQNTWSAKILKQ